MPRLLERLGIELPVVQAGMGGGLSGHRLAASVAEAGGLGTIGIVAPDELRRELELTRGLTGGPVAVNLLLPFARRGHWESAAGADAVVTFWGRPRRRTPNPWIHQCGSVDEARGAHAAGADAVIAQGVEAGGHVRGPTPALELLERVLAALPDGFPVLSAGAIADRDSVRERLDAGASAVVAGTRFLLSEESEAHPAYKQRLLDARDTVLTELFGAGWPAAHRVVPNVATERWLRSDPRGPTWIRALNRITAPAASRLPDGLQLRLAAAQRPWQPILGPIAAVAGGGDNLVDSGPLYAGKCVAEIDEVRPAAELVRTLAG